MRLVALTYVNLGGSRYDPAPSGGGRLTGSFPGPDEISEPWLST